MHVFAYTLIQNGTKTALLFCRFYKGYNRVLIIKTALFFYYDMEAKNYSFRVDATKSKVYKDSSSPVTLVIRKEGQRKKIYLGISATIVEIKKKDGNTEFKSQWNEKFQRYEIDGRKGLHPDCERLNKWLDTLSGRCDELIKDFEKKKIDWTLNQFEDSFLNKTKKKGIEIFFDSHIQKLNDAGKIGNKICYQNTLHILQKFDKDFGKKIFSEIDKKFVNNFHQFLYSEGCANNTIVYYQKALRALINKAIEEGEASATSYPFGKDGYSIAKVCEVTDKRYLPSEHLETIKTAILDKYVLNWSRNLFLFSYYCQGMSFVDVAHLKRTDIVQLESGKYLKYRRQKTEAKQTRFIHIKITDQIQTLLNWFEDHCTLIGDYITPVVSIEGYKGEELYTHIRNRYKKLNIHLKALATELKIEGIKLTSYVSRHSYAMRLKNSGIAEDVISEALGHKDLSTTKVYLDSFQNDEISKANEVL